MMRVLPASHDTPLGLAYGDIIADDKELDLVDLGRMLCSKLLLGKTEVENISGVVSTEW
jgi:hypothetical protein